MSYNLEKKISIMGILNITPDSFYDGGKYTNTKSTLARVKEMLAQGVDIIDIGAESTRPGSQSVSLNEELSRLIPVVSEIRKISKIPLSIDTTKADVIQELIQYRIQIINDISAGSDNSMIRLAKDNDLYISLMHMQKKPETMQEEPKYENVINEIYSYLSERFQRCVEHGIDKSKIIIDPGFGFGKTVKHNYTILNNLEKFSNLTDNILVGISRKSMIGAVTNKEPSDRLHGSLAAETISIVNKAKIIRVHDIAETSVMIKTLEHLI